MSTTVRKTASRRGEDCLEMNLGVEVEVEIEVNLVILFCEKSAEKSDVRKRAWAFRSRFVERIGLDSTGHSWNSPAIASNHCLRLGDSHRTLVVRIQE